MVTEEIINKLLISDITFRIWVMEREYERYFNSLPCYPGGAIVTDDSPYIKSNDLQKQISDLKELLIRIQKEARTEAGL
jgi:hypothetical protein